MSIFDFHNFYHKNTKVPDPKFLTFFSFDRILKHNLFFTLILSTIKRKMKLSGNFTFLTMLQSVVWFRKIENWKLQSIFNFCFLAKTLKIINITTQEGGRGVHLHSNFFSPVPLPPLPSSPTLHFSGKEEAGNSYLPCSHFSTISHHKITNDLIALYMLSSYLWDVWWQIHQIFPHDKKRRSIIEMQDIKSSSVSQPVHHVSKLIP